MPQFFSNKEPSDTGASTSQPLNDAADPGDAHLDSDVLAALREVMDEDYPILLDTFISDSEERVRILGSALRALDVEAMGLAAHSFKGSSSNMGAPVLAGLCRELEDLARRQQSAGAATLVAKIEAEFVIVRRLFLNERLRFD